jgi:hypothetical protein
MKEQKSEPATMLDKQPELSGQQVVNAQSSSVQKSIRPKTLYTPYQIAKDSQHYLELRRKFPQPAECPPNAMITNIRGEWRRGISVSLTYAKTMIVIIEGKNLQELFQSLKEWRIDWLQEFDWQTHLPVDANNIPFIKKIEIITSRPEPLPPMNQRH